MLVRHERPIPVICREETRSRSRYLSLLWPRPASGLDPLYQRPRSSTHRWTAWGRCCSNRRNSPATKAAWTTRGEFKPTEKRSRVIRSWLGSVLKTSGRYCGENLDVRKRKTTETKCVAVEHQTAIRADAESVASADQWGCLASVKQLSSRVNATVLWSSGANNRIPGVECFGTVNLKATSQEVLAGLVHKFWDVE